MTDDDQDAWNITRLNTILDYVSEDYGIKIEGYLYAGFLLITRLLSTCLIESFGILEAIGKVLFIPPPPILFHFQA